MRLRPHRSPLLALGVAVAFVALAGLEGCASPAPDEAPPNGGGAEEGTNAQVADVTDSLATIEGDQTAGTRVAVVRSTRYLLEGARIGDSRGRGRLRKELLELLDAVVQDFDRRIDILTLRLKRDDTRLILLQRRLRLGALVDFVEIEDFFDLDEREANALAAEDQLQLGAVAVRVDAVHAVAARGQETLVFVKAERPRRDLELSSQLRNRIGALRSLDR